MQQLLVDGTDPYDMGICAKRALKSKAYALLYYAVCSHCSVLPALIADNFPRFSAILKDTRT